MAIQGNHMKAKSAKQLLESHGLPLSAHSLYEGLRLAGLLVSVQYESTSATGEFKEFNQLLDEAQKYGKNKASGFHPVKTEIQFFDEMFLQVYLIACKALHEDAQRRLSGLH